MNNTNKYYDLRNVVIEDIDFNDYPDFCDSFLASAEWKDGTPLNEIELDELNEDTDVIYEYVMRELYG